MLLSMVFVSLSLSHHPALCDNKFLWLSNRYRNAHDYDDSSVSPAASFSLSTVCVSAWHGCFSFPSPSPSLLIWNNSLFVLICLFFSGFCIFSIISHKKNNLSLEPNIHSICIHLWLFVCVCTVDSRATLVPHRTQISMLRPANPPPPPRFIKASVKCHIHQPQTHAHCTQTHTHCTPTYWRLELLSWDGVVMKTSGKKCIKVWSFIQWI